MPPRDTIHYIVKQAITKYGWKITDDPYVIFYGERFLFVDLGLIESKTLDQIEGRFIGAERENRRIAIEIKEFQGRSAIADLEQAIGQYVLYRLLLNKVDLPLKLVIVNVEKAEVTQWIPPRSTETL